MTQKETNYNLRDEQREQLKHVQSINKETINACKKLKLQNPWSGQKLQEIN